VGDKIAEQVRKIKNTMSPVIETMKSINKEFDSVSTYKVENLISVIEKFNNMSSADKKLIEILLNNQSNF
jgi:DNA anti-recombination protein RmuC